MHELAITQNLLSTILQEAKAAHAEKVTTIVLVVGELSGAVSDCIQFYFDVLKKGTLAETATIEFKMVAAQLRCRDCGSKLKPDNEIWSCPECHKQNMEIVGGRDCFIESMEVEP